MRSLVRMLPFVRPYWKASVLSLLLLVGMVTADLLIPRMTQRVIDVGIARGDTHVLLTTSLTMLGAACVSAMFAVTNTVLSVRVGQSVGADIRSRFIRHIQTFSFADLDTIQTGQLLVRATSDVNQVQMIVLMTLRILTRAPMWALGSIVMLIITSPRLALLLVVMLPVVTGVLWLFARMARPLFAHVQSALDGLNQVLQENLAGVRVVKAFVRTAYEGERFDEANVGLMHRTTRVMLLMAVLMPTTSLVLNLGMAAAVWFGGNLAIDGALTIGQIVAFNNYLLFATFPMVMLGMMIGPLSAADASAARILEVLDRQVSVQNWPHARALSHVQGRVAFENVSFDYDGEDGGQAVLVGLDLVAEPGQEVAILGATGSGKSSLVHLIPRFYDVTGGRVTLDGVDVRDISLETLRAPLGIALQEPVLFSGTVRDNIRYGRADATDEEVVAAARAAQAHDFIAAFPDGYDTVVGQRGVNLSGGQKQRIAIARALLVRPRILILDDSTSAVDVETEAKIQQSLHERLAGCTRFVIAQRISTVLAAEKIVVLDKGRIAAVGTHAELIVSSPIYQEIYASQLGDGGASHG